MQQSNRLLTEHSSDSGACAMTQRILYLDAWSGLSGDMMLAALLDVGRDEPQVEGSLHAAVESLGLAGVRVEVSREVEWGIACTRVRVTDEHAPSLRRLDEMVRVIQSADVSDPVRKQSLDAMTRLAEVEAAVHGCSVEEIHFHEVGAADTIVDVLGACVLVEALAVTRVYVSEIPLGGGMVEIAHGRMGVPAPATTLLLEGYRVRGGPEMRELTTPTGALLVRQLQAVQGPLPRMTVDRVGYGAGTMKLDGGPNVLRTVLGRADTEGPGLGGSRPPEERHAAVELVTNLDDVSAEVIGHTVRRLREDGALDVWTVAAQMKKDRPGVVLHALVPVDAEGCALDTIFKETGTLGVRRQLCDRHVAERGVVTATVDGAAVRVKWGRWRDAIVSIAPEHDDAASVAVAQKKPLKEVMRLATEAARTMLEAGSCDG